ncbi:hypothetical protein GCM10027517_24370 [Phycicoccus ginsengisoli]
MSWHTLLVATLVVLVCSVALAVVVALTKVLRTRRERATRAALAPYRMHLVALAAGEDEDGDHLQTLMDAPEAVRGVIDDAVVEFLQKVRGAPTEELSMVLLTHGALERAPHHLRSRHERERARAAQMLGLCRVGSALPLLIEALRDTSLEVRVAAAQALGQLGEATAAAPLLAAVGAEHGIPAGVGADAVGSLGVGVAPALVDALASPSPTTRTVAAYVSGIGSFRRSVPALRELVRSDPELSVRETSATALGSIGAADDVEVLAQHTAAPHPLPLRRICAEALGTLGDPAAVPHLAALLGDPDPRLAEIAATSLLQLGPTGHAAVQPVEQAEAESAQQGIWDPRRGLPVASAATMEALREGRTDGVRGAP